MAVQGLHLLCQERLLLMLVAVEVGLLHLVQLRVLAVLVAAVLAH
jgi:hypothetical protein